MLNILFYTWMLAISFMLPNPYYVLYIMKICLDKNTKDILQISLFHIIIFHENILS